MSNITGVKVNDKKEKGIASKPKVSASKQEEIASEQKETASEKRKRKCKKFHLTLKINQLELHPISKIYNY